MSEEIDKNKHKNTRYMAWIAFWASLLYPLLLLTDKSEAFIDFSDVFYWFTGGIVLLGYIGITNARDGWGKK